MKLSLPVLVLSSSLLGETTVLGFSAPTKTKVLTAFDQAVEKNLLVIEPTEKGRRNAASVSSSWNNFVESLTEAEKLVEDGTIFQQEEYLQELQETTRPRNWQAMLDRNGEDAKLPRNWKAMLDFSNGEDVGDSVVRKNVIKPPEKASGKATKPRQWQALLDHLGAVRRPRNWQAMVDMVNDGNTDVAKMAVVHRTFTRYPKTWAALRAYVQQVEEQRYPEKWAALRAYVQDTNVKQQQPVLEEQQQQQSLEEVAPEKPQPVQEILEEVASEKPQPVQEILEEVASDKRQPVQAIKEPVAVQDSGDNILQQQYHEQPLPQGFNVVRDWAKTLDTPPPLNLVYFQLRNTNVAAYAAAGNSRWSSSEVNRAVWQTDVMQAAATTIPVEETQEQVTSIQVDDKQTQEVPVASEQPTTTKETMQSTTPIQIKPTPVVVSEEKQVATPTAPVKKSSPYAERRPINKFFAQAQPDIAWEKQKPLAKIEDDYLTLNLPVTYLP